jgi:hypothetical protein
MERCVRKVETSKKALRSDTEILRIDIAENEVTRRAFGRLSNTLIASPFKASTRKDPFLVSRK